jgi:3-methyladenine DNA glycosylase AlkC
VFRRGLQSPHRALATLHALTQRFTDDWLIRAFIEQHPEDTFKTLALWASESNVSFAAPIRTVGPEQARTFQGY